MHHNKTVLFKPYPFSAGEHIHIKGGARNGDWEIVGVTEHKIRLKCLRSMKEYEWDRFCFFVDESGWDNVSAK